LIISFKQCRSHHLFKFRIAVHEPTYQSKLILGVDDDNQCGGYLRDEISLPLNADGQIK